METTEREKMLAKFDEDVVSIFSFLRGLYYPSHIITSESYSDGDTIAFWKIENPKEKYFKESEKRIEKVYIYLLKNSPTEGVYFKVEILKDLIVAKDYTREVSVRDSFRKISRLLLSKIFSLYITNEIFLKNK